MSIYDKDDDVFFPFELIDTFEYDFDVPQGTPAKVVPISGTRVSCRTSLYVPLIGCGWLCYNCNNRNHFWRIFSVIYNNMLKEINIKNISIA